MFRFSLSRCDTLFFHDILTPDDDSFPIQYQSQTFIQEVDCFFLHFFRSIFIKKIVFFFVCFIYKREARELRLDLASFRDMQDILLLFSRYIFLCERVCVLNDDCYRLIRVRALIRYMFSLWSVIVHSLHFLLLSHTKSPHIGMDVLCIGVCGAVCELMTIYVHIRFNRVFAMNSRFRRWNFSRSCIYVAPRTPVRMRSRVILEYNH